jgi:hypothetical protein
MATPSPEPLQAADTTEWTTLFGGELEGQRPRALCPTCRDHDRLALKLICFQCYRAGLQRDRALVAAGQLDTGSDARFQYARPFSPVNTARLAALKAERARVKTQVKTQAKAQITTQLESCAHRRRRAQIAARHALFPASSFQPLASSSRPRPARTIGAVTVAADLQFPESWLPFVMSSQASLGS